MISRHIFVVIFICDFGVNGGDFSYFSTCKFIGVIIKYCSYMFDVVCKMTREVGGCKANVGIRGSYVVWKSLLK